MNFRTVVDLLTVAEFVEIGEVPAVVRDPKDDMVMATAIAGHANYIVTEDKDLLELGKVSGISIVDTQTFLTPLESNKGQSAKNVPYEE